MDNPDLENLYLKKIEGTLSPEEQSYLDRRLQGNPSDKIEFEKIDALWKASRKLSLEKGVRAKIGGLGFSKAFILRNSPDLFPYIELSGDMPRQLPCWPFLSPCISIQIRAKSSGSKRNMRNQRLFGFRINRQ